MELLDLIVMALASFRLTRLVVKDKIFEKIRSPFFNEVEIEGETYLEPKGFIGNLISCQWCVGFWVSGLVVVLYNTVPASFFLLLIFAVSGLQSLLWKGLDD